MPPAWVVAAGCQLKALELEAGEGLEAEGEAWGRRPTGAENQRDWGRERELLTAGGETTRPGGPRRRFTPEAGHPVGCGGSSTPSGPEGFAPPAAWPRPRPPSLAAAARGACAAGPPPGAHGRTLCARACAETLPRLEWLRVDDCDDLDFCRLAVIITCCCTRWLPDVPIFIFWSEGSASVELSWFWKHS